MIQIKEYTNGFIWILVKNKSVVIQKANKISSS